MVDMTITKMAGFKAARPLDKDKLHMLPRETAARSAQGALSGIQQESPEALVLGAATLFAAVCRRARLDPKDLHHMGLRVLDAPMDGDHPTDASVQVLRDFVGGRVMGEDVTIG